MTRPAISPDRLAQARKAAAEAGPRRPARHARARPALADRLRRTPARAAHLPGPAGCGRRRSWSHRGSRCPRSPPRRWAASASRCSAGARPTTRTPWSPAGCPRRRAGRRWPTGCGPSRCCGSRALCPAAEQTSPSEVLRDLRMRKAPRRGRRAAQGRLRPSTGCTPGWRSGSGRAAPSERPAADIADRDPRRGPRDGRLRHRRVRAQRRVSPHHEVSDRVDRGRRPRRRRHRRDDGRGLLLRLHPDVRAGRAARRVPAYFRGPARGAARGLRCRAARGDRRVGRRRGARRHHRRRLRRCVHPPHRPRHRRGDARGPLHRRGQHPGARAGHGVLDRAGHLPARAPRRAHRGHRRLHRRRASSG